MLEMPFFSSPKKIIQLSLLFRGRGIPRKIPEKSPKFGAGTGTNSVYNSGTGRGGDSSVATGNFEVYPRKIPEIRGGDGDNNFEEITHSKCKR